MFFCRFVFLCCFTWVYLCFVFLRACLASHIKGGVFSSVDCNRKYALYDVPVVLKYQKLFACPIYIYIIYILPAENSPSKRPAFIDRENAPLAVSLMINSECETTNGLSRELRCIFFSGVCLVGHSGRTK